MLIDDIIDYVNTKLENENWKCKCGECFLSKFQSLTDDDILDIIRNYDRNLLGS